MSAEVNSSHGLKIWLFIKSGFYCVNIPIY